MRDLGRRNEAAPELWSFLEFTVTHRTPLYIVLMPFILHKVNLDNIFHMSSIAISVYRSPNRLLVTMKGICNF